MKENATTRTIKSNVDSLGQLQLDKNAAVAIGKYILGSLELDRENLQQLDELLKKERLALSHCDVKELETIASQKLELAQSLESRAMKRASTTSQYGLICFDSKSWLNAIETVEELAGLSIWPTWEQVEQLLKSVDEQSRVNEKIVNAMQHSANQFVALIRQESGEETPASYDAVGRNHKGNTHSAGRPLASA